ncbi:MAG TPA: RpiB/LacA/LacB family sugar-phosphate isomerase, partial [Candidatus Magasanikbacteria bacterium]|nr:RpiB/LacA/LacB family sugar-phosphate isomerase [Candidatus Magasanikbacteria bacterium]
TVTNRGLAILICGSGNGACMAANKVHGIRAALGYNIEAAEMARKHNNANALCLAGRVLSDDHATAIVKKFLESEFSTDPKYARRNDKITTYENSSK